MSTNYLKEVLRIAPSTWTGTSYSSSNYATVELDEESEEYTDLVEILQEEEKDYEDNIRKIKRVQHPFAYGRFVLRKEQLKKRENTSVKAKSSCMQINKSVVKLALEYNLDQRRTPYINRHSSSRGKHACVAVVKSLRRPAHLLRDSEIYPEYVVYYDD